MMLALRSVLLALLLMLPLAAPGAVATVSADTARMDSAMGASLHECCTPTADKSHGDCALCAALGQPLTALRVARLPRGIRHLPETHSATSVALRLPLPPPRLPVI